jgi:hypothetical protein
LIEFTDCLQSLLYLAVALQRLADLGNLIGAETQLAGAAAGIADIENPERMPSAVGAFGTTAGMVKGSFEQGAAEHIAEVGEAGEKLVAVGGGLLVCHLY